MSCSGFVGGRRTLWACSTVISRGFWWSWGSSPTPVPGGVGVLGDEEALQCRVLVGDSGYFFGWVVSGMGRQGPTDHGVRVMLTSCRSFKESKIDVHKHTHTHKIQIDTSDSHSWLLSVTLQFEERLTLSGSEQECCRVVGEFVTSGFVKKCTQIDLRGEKREWTLGCLVWFKVSSLGNDAHGTQSG